jgi:hypothetical protein
MRIVPSTPVEHAVDPAPELRLPSALARALALALQAIRFGTIELVIHDGRVVQLERREKVRFGHERRDGVS